MVLFEMQMQFSWQLSDENLSRKLAWVSVGSRIFRPLAASSRVLPLTYVFRSRSVARNKRLRVRIKEKTRGVRFSVNLSIGRPATLPVVSISSCQGISTEIITEILVQLHQRLRDQRGYPRLFPQFYLPSNFDVDCFDRATSE